jgi:hypothetical protein
MKPIWSLLFLLWSVSTQAQQTTILTQQEPNVPSILPAEAATFFRTFEDAVQYLASKGKPRDQRRAFAQRFSMQFATDAVIQVMNGKKKLNLKPLDYFYRLVDLNYDSIDISFNIESEQAWQQKSEWWSKQYGFTQSTVCKKKGLVTES